MHRVEDKCMATVRGVVCSAGFDETLNPSLIGRAPTDRISPWTDAEPLTTIVPLLEGASTLRRSLIPSLIAARLHNQSQSNRSIQLFEVAKVYLPRGDELPLQQLNLGLISDANDRIVRGAFEEIILRTCGEKTLDCLVTSPLKAEYLEPGSGIGWWIEGSMLAWSGQLARSLSGSIKLEGIAAAGELNLDLLFQYAIPVPQLKPIAPFPAIERDLNLVVDESLQWQTLQGLIARSAGELCTAVHFKEIYRDPKKDGAGKKRMLLSITLQSQMDTLRSEQADAVVASVLSECKEKLGAVLLS
jgi:phenylalanyl-tRNA synthetase beta chain